MDIIILLSTVVYIALHYLVLECSLEFVVNWKQDEDQWGSTKAQQSTWSYLSAYFQNNNNCSDGDDKLILNNTIMEIILKMEICRMKGTEIKMCPS